MATIIARPIEGRAAWLGEELARTTDWIRRITDDEVAEVDAALAAVKRRGLAWHEITRSDFPLSRLARTLAEVSRELEDGRGVVLLRGLPVERYTDEELKQLYWGIGTYLGAVRCQNAPDRSEVAQPLRSLSQPR